jgi:hypothetical protein
MSTKKSGIFFWSGLLVICLLYGVYYLFFLYGVFVDAPIRVRHFIKFIFILPPYLIGVYCLKLRTSPWIMKVWKVVYLGVLLLLVLLGIFDWGITRVPLDIRVVADDLQELLISPLLYVGMGLLGRRYAG